MSLLIKDFLKALDNLIISSSLNSEPIKLTDEQKGMLKMSDVDIKNGNLISQKAMNQRSLEWINTM